MIRYLELRNWRAFNKVALHLSEGTTFVVAENGIGKTSLLRGAAWTLFAPRHVDPKVELRHGDGEQDDRRGGDVDHRRRSRDRT